MDAFMATEIAYKNGFEAGEQAAAKKIFLEIDKLHLHVANEYEAQSYEELKKKYGIN